MAYPHHFENMLAGGLWRRLGCNGALSLKIKESTMKNVAQSSTVQNMLLDGCVRVMLLSSRSRKQAGLQRPANYLKRISPRRIWPTARQLTISSSLLDTCCAAELSRVISGRGLLRTVYARLQNPSASARPRGLLAVLAFSEASRTSMPREGLLQAPVADFSALLAMDSALLGTPVGLIERCVSAIKSAHVRSPEYTVRR